MYQPAVDPQSSSEVLRATTILLIELRNISFGSWVPDPNRSLLVRKVTMQVTILEILKGEVQQQAGVPFKHRIQQWGTGDSIIMDYYGLWSHVTLIDGIQFVAFCIGESNDATDLLDEPHCEQLLPSEQALDDTRAALNLEAQHLSGVELLGQAASLAARHGDIFARYIAAKTGPSAPMVEALIRAASVPTVSPDNNFEALMTIAEDPRTNEAARQAYLTSAYEELGMMTAPPQERVVLLIRTMLHILILPHAHALHSAITDVYLPNILGLNNSQTTFESRNVFDDNERRDLLEALRGRPTSDSLERIIQWLET